MSAKESITMHTSLKRISTIGFTVVVIEAVAWVGLTLFGADGLAAIWPTQQHPSATDAIVTAHFERSRKVLDLRWSPVLHRGSRQTNTVDAQSGALCDP
jgi:hypothetical protein